VDLTQLVAQHGLSIVFANVLLHQLGVPLPAMPMLVVAGALIGDGSLNLAPLLAVVVVASLMGDVPWYYAGRRYGYRILRTVCRISIEPDSCVKQTENIFMRFGPRSLIVAKYIPGFGTIAPPLAGTMKLPLGPFLAYSIAGSLAWAALPVAGGVFFRTQVDWLMKQLAELGGGAIAALAVVLLAYVAFKGVERYLLIRFLRMVRVGPEELRDMMSGDSPPVVFDVRSPVAREAEPRRVPGALSIALEDVQALVSTVPPDRDVIVYCS
jgi:membrane protein DedA with SNARE-associated domain